MLDNLVKDLVKQYAGSAVINNPSIPNDKNESAINSIADGILGGLKQQATGSGLNSVIGMLTKSGHVDAAISRNIQGFVVNSLVSKLGIGKKVASSIASQIVPVALGALSKSIAGKNALNIDLSGIFNSLTGGKTTSGKTTVAKTTSGKTTGSKATSGKTTVAKTTSGKTKGLNVESLIDKSFGNGDGKLDMNDLTSALGNLFGKK